ncbi:MAG: thymidylate synthase [Nanoarchaeota archaeon]|nr:thymidylate synthase [Nanoarchaeota archaeon]
MDEDKRKEINEFDYEYHKLLQFLLDKGDSKEDRTGVGTISHFGYQMRFDLSKGFPLLTTKKVFHRSIFHELIWFLQGSTNIKYLVDNNVNIWNEWPFQFYLKANNLEDEFLKYSEKWHEKLKEFVENVKEDEEFAKKWGELGPVYGKQWRDFNGVDQISRILKEIKETPHSRRIIVNAWNAAEIEEMQKSGLPPCHTMFQFYVKDNKLSCQLYQRSADVFLGVPFNIASYAALTYMVAHVCDLEVGDFVHTFGDVHIYNNHIEQVKEQLSRSSFEPPKFKINTNTKNLFDITFENLEIIEYKSQTPIKAPIAV